MWIELAAICIKWVGHFFMNKVSFRSEFDSFLWLWLCMCALELILGVLREAVFVELSFAWGFGLVFVG